MFNQINAFSPAKKEGMEIFSEIPKASEEYPKIFVLIPNTFDSSIRDIRLLTEADLPLSFSISAMTSITSEEKQAMSISRKQRHQ